MLYIPLHINGHMVSEITARRVEPQDVTDPAIKDTINTYEIRRDGLPMGTVRHRYGDQAIRLTALAAEMVADLDGCECRHAGLALMFHLDCPAAKTWRERGSR